MKAKGSITKQEAELEISKEEVDLFFKGIIPQFVRDAGGILSDNVRFWRWKNQVKIIKQAEVIVKESNLQKKEIPLKVLVPLIENSSLEEEETMQLKWANLLANAATGKVNVTPNYVAILNELSPIEAQLLDILYNNVTKENDYQKRKTMQFAKDKVCEVLKLSSEAFDLIIENLFRLGLCRPPGSTGIMFGDSRVALQTTSVFELTTLGFDFVKACR